MIKAIIFDCFGVLTADSWLAFLSNLPPDADIKRARELNHQLDAGLIDYREFLEGVHQATGQEPKMIEEHVSNTPAKNTQLLNYIAELKGQYKIGLLSNVSTNWIRDTFLDEKEQALFDEMVFSFEVGTTKPNPRIFKIVCEKLGVEPAQAVMIDDIDRYAVAARGVGMQGIVYHDFSQMKRELETTLTNK